MHGCTMIAILIVFGVGLLINYILERRKPVDTEPESKQEKIDALLDELMHTLNYAPPIGTATGYDRLYQYTQDAMSVVRRLKAELASSDDTDETTVLDGMTVLEQKCQEVGNSVFQRLLVELPLEGFSGWHMFPTIAAGKGESYRAMTIAFSHVYGDHQFHIGCEVVQANSVDELSDVIFFGVVEKRLKSKLKWSDMNNDLSTKSKQDSSDYADTKDESSLWKLAVRVDRDRANGLIKEYMNTEQDLLMDLARAKQDLDRALIDLIGKSDGDLLTIRKPE